MSVFTSEVFECSGVSAYKIPPGDTSVSNWSICGKNLVWTGKVRLLEQEEMSDSPLTPLNRLRLKLELIIVDRPANHATGELEIDQVWGEVWYNPQHRLDKEQVPPFVETIVTSDSYRMFKVIAQIPGTGYVIPKEHPIQVALGIKFNDKIDAYTFKDRIVSYQRRFQSYVEQYNYDKDMEELVESQREMSLEEEEFGDFVGS